jgi:GNAT superfamily N-acetyltransferase
MHLAPETVSETLDATWPAARRTARGGWVLRAAPGAGRRVNAATAMRTGTCPEADELLRAGHGVAMVRAGEDTLDARLEEAGWRAGPSVTLWVLDCAKLAKRAGPGTVIGLWPPLAAAEDIWEATGSGPERRAVMERVRTSRAGLLARDGDRPAAAAFVARHGSAGVLHQLATLPGHRRRGVARRLLAAAAHWTAQEGGTALWLFVEDGNSASEALCRSCGAVSAPAYRYRLAPGLPE